MGNIKDKLKNIIVVIPSLNPDEKLMKVVESMMAAGFSRVLVVNDGSDTEHLRPFSEAKETPGCTVLGYEENRGKGHALKTAFKYITENEPSCRGVVTVDGDGQHGAEDSVLVASDMIDHPGCVVLGCRDFSKKDVPTHNMLGNRITSLIFGLLCGIKLSDTQTGLRGIPGEYLAEFSEIDGERFEYETNMLLYMKEKGIGLIERSIDTIYIEDNKSSHFRVFRDSAKIYKPILKFSLGSIMSMLIDLSLFTILCRVFSHLPDTQEIFLATLGARIVSSLFNYFYNRNAVFKSEASDRSSMLRYYILAAMQLTASWLGVSALSALFKAAGFAKTAIKVLVDVTLFLISFQVQREWVFKKEK